MKLVLFVIFGFAFRVFGSFTIYSGDLNNHMGWGASILDFGGIGAYAREYRTIMQPTYPPASVYAFVSSEYIYRVINDAIKYLNTNLTFFPSKVVWLFEDQDVRPAFQKIIAIVSDLGLTILVWRITRSKFLGLIYLLNPAVWYTSSLWGQIETFPLFLLVAGVYSLYRRNLITSTLLVTLALLSKQSMIIFLPIYGLLWLSQTKFGFLKLKAGLLAFGLFWLAYLPLWSGNSLAWPIQVYLDRIQTGSGSDYLSDHAFNLWALYAQLDKIPDKGLAWLGYLAFSILYLVIVFFWFKKRQDIKYTFFALGLVQISAFLVLTRMHERYLAPALFFLLIPIQGIVNFFIYILLSIVHLANLYHNWWFPRFDGLVLFLDNWQTIQYLIYALIGVFIYFAAIFFKQGIFGKNRL